METKNTEAAPAGEDTRGSARGSAGEATHGSTKGPVRRPAAEATNGSTHGSARGSATEATNGPVRRPAAEATNGSTNGSARRPAAEATKGPAGADAPRTGAAYTAARAVSVVLHPFLLPVYAMLVFLYGDTMFTLAAPRTKLFLMAVVVLNAIVVPALAIVLLRALGMISDLSFRSRLDRTVPLAIVALCYGLCIIMVSDLVFGFVVRKFFIAAFCCAMAALIVTPFWRISLHMIAAGGVTAMFAVYMLIGMGSTFIPLIVSILLSGALGSARLWLGKHNPAQVAVGFLTGLVVAGAALLFLK